MYEKRVQRKDRRYSSHRRIPIPVEGGLDLCGLNLI